MLAAEEYVDAAALLLYQHSALVAAGHDGSAHGVALAFASFENFGYGCLGAAYGEPVGGQLDVIQVAGRNLEGRVVDPGDSGHAAALVLGYGLGRV